MGEKCIEMVGRGGMLVRRVHKPMERMFDVNEWTVMNKSREGLEWYIKIW